MVAVELRARVQLTHADDQRERLTLNKILSACRLIFRRSRYRVGATLSRFIAPDVRREVDIVDVAELHQGFVKARIRTWNVLYAYKGLLQKPDFSEPKRVEIRKLWEWNGAVWGGPVPLVENITSKHSEPPTGA